MSSTLKSTPACIKPIPLKPISNLHGQPRVLWEQEKVNQMIVNENLQYALLEKFSTDDLIFKI